MLKLIPKLLLVGLLFGLSQGAQARTWGVTDYSQDPNADHQRAHVFGDYFPVEDYQDPDFDLALEYSSPLDDSRYDDYQVIVVSNKYQPRELAQTVRVYMRGEGLVFFWKTSTGRSGHDTPAGYFRPQYFSSNHRSSIYGNAPMPWAVFFNGNIATHGTPHLYFLGFKASAGCLRLEPQRAEDLFHLVGQSGEGMVAEIGSDGDVLLDQNNQPRMVESYRSLFIISN